MKNLLLIFCLLLSAVIDVKPQTPVPPSPQQTTQSQREQRERMLEEIRQRERANRQFEQLRAIGAQNDDSTITFPRQLSGNSVQYYRKLTKREAALLAPAEEDRRKYADFLLAPNSGLIKLAADKGCADNEKIAVVTVDCLAFTMPGAGSSYSFRTRNYRIARLADITFTENSFQATGIRLHGIFVNIGDVPLEQVSLQTGGIKYLTDFKPVADFQKAKELDARLSEGIKADGYVYRRALRTVDNTTFVLRSVAYRGKYMRAFSGFTYNELALDKRIDVIVAFRIVRRGDDGSVTILWKQLAKQASPKTKWDKDENGDAQLKTVRPTDK